MQGEELNFFQKDITSDFLEHFATEEVWPGMGMKMDTFMGMDMDMHRDMDMKMGTRHGHEHQALTWGWTQDFGSWIVDFLEE